VGSPRSTAGAADPFLSGGPYITIDNLYTEVLAKAIGVSADAPLFCACLHNILGATIFLQGPSLIVPAILPRYHNLRYTQHGRLSTSCPLCSDNKTKPTCLPSIFSRLNFHPLRQRMLRGRSRRIPHSYCVPLPLVSEPHFRCPRLAAL
jgi:hypothetical protein